MPTQTGNERLRFNTRERVLSSDFNRSQAFSGRHLAEAFRFLLDAQAETDSYAGSVESTAVGTEAPLRAVVLNGIRPRPEVGTINLFIEPGEILLADQSAPSADDSICALVSDPGVLAAGVLTLTAGAGSVRIDVIECQRVLVVLESDNRDVFNQGTGLFNPVQVDKVTTSRLTYRIRQGTPGAGFPGVVAGWLPLAVCKVAAGAATWDSVVLWDVRPLASDRWNAPFDSPRTVPTKGRQLVFTDVTTNGAQRRVGGIIEAEWRGYKAGGHLGCTSGIAPNGQFIDVADTANQARNFPGYSANDFYYVYAVFPFGLPRWVRYCDPGAGARIPVGQRGILAVTNVAPSVDGTPSGLGLGVNSPTNTGLLDSNAGNALVLLAGRVDAAGPPPVPLGVAIDGGKTTLINDLAVTVNPSGGVANVSSQWTLTDHTTHPAGARAVYVKLYAEFTTTGAWHFYVSGQVQVTGPAANTAAFATCEDSGTENVTATAGQLCVVEIVARVPLASDPFGGAGTTRVYRVKWTYNPLPNGGVITVANQTLQVLAWEMGP